MANRVPATTRTKQGYLRQPCSAIMSVCSLRFASQYCTHPSIYSNYEVKSQPESYVLSTHLLLQKGKEAPDLGANERLTE